MKAAKILFISALFTIVLFENCNIFIAKTAVPQAEVNPAYYYGQQIYTKENCSSCHNFNILEKTDGKVSLDGIGNKYSDAWLYYYFFEPSSVYPASEKKAYDHLYQNEVDYDLLSKLIKKNYKKQDPDKLKADFNQELNEIKVELAKQGIEANYSEILPLIYFIQGIPESDAKHRMDSTKELEKTERLNAVLNEVITASNDSGSVVKGKQLFKKYCAVCHGDSGQGYIGPNHTDEYWIHGGTKTNIAKSIYLGVPDKGMIVWGNQLSTQEIGKLVAYVYSLRGSKPSNAKPPQGIKDTKK